jgi:hypothetical protein
VSNQETPIESRRWMRLCVVAVFVCIVGGAAARGDYLLGAGAAVLFGLAACGAMFLVYRAFSAAGALRFVHRTTALLFAVVVLTILAIPAQFNSDIGALAELHRMQRETQSELQRVFAGDPRFARLQFECHCRKCVVVRVQGTIATQSDLHDLRKRILADCPDGSSRWLYWEVTIEESGNKCRGCDLELFGDPSKGQSSKDTRK